MFQSTMIHKVVKYRTELVKRERNNGEPYWIREVHVEYENGDFATFTFFSDIETGLEVSSGI